MLRITRDDAPLAGVTLKLEGRLGAEWVGVLEAECLGLLRSPSIVRLDLSGVTFVERAGVALLRRLHLQGVELCRCSDAVAGVLEGEGLLVERNGKENIDGKT